MFINRIPTRKTLAFTTFTSQYPPEQNATYVKATSNYAGWYAYNATNPSNSLIGGYGPENTWNTIQNSNQRFHIDLGSAKQIDRIYYENSHNAGGNTNYSCKNFTLWGSDNAAAFAELTYGTDTNWTQITTATAVFEQHVALNQADPKYILVSGSPIYRYYAFKFADTWGGQMTLRRVELQTGS